MVNYVGNGMSICHDSEELDRFIGVRPTSGWSALNKESLKFSIESLGWDFELSFEGVYEETGKYKLLLNGC